MKITIESTSKIVTLQRASGEVPARVWQGYTESGIPVQVFVTLISPEVPKSDPDIDAKTAEFERDLKRVADPRPSIEAIPLRLIL
jgi:hypothetical protein